MMMKFLLENSFLMICIFLFANISNVSAGQTSHTISSFNLVGEKCVIHLDKSFYVTGEVMWYKMYFPKSFDKKPITVKVSLIDKNGKVKGYSFHETSGKAYFSSYYKIPFGSSSGVYSLVISGVKSSTKTTVKLAEVPVPIYNDLQTVRIVTSDLADPMNLPSNTTPVSDNPLKVTVEVDKSNYSSREKVNVIVKVTDASGQPVAGNCSVAVSDNSLTGESVFPNYIVAASPLPPNIVANNLNNTMHIRGDFLDKNNDPKKVEVMGMFSPKENEFLFTASKDDGKFYFEMPSKFVGTKPLQFVNHYEIDNEATVKISKEVKKEINQDLVYTEGVINYLKLSRERKKIFQMYDGFESNIQPELSSFEKKTFDPDKDYNLRNYSKFKDLPTFFTEVLTYLKFKKEKGIYSAKMTNPNPTWEGNYPGAPLFIVDGKITRDGDFVAKLEYSHIDQVDLFFDVKNLKNQFNILGKSGVIEIKTDLPKMLVPEEDEKRIFPISGLQPKASFPVYNPSQNTNSNIPFFRPQLFWNPEVTIQPNGEGQFSFFQTDDKSTFKVHVVVQGENGEMGYGSTIYEVEMR